jgi:O-antigen/teichoic acid export membrane protein
LDLEIGRRWQHPIHVEHGRTRPPGARAAVRTGRMATELAIARALSGAVATVWLGIVAHQLSVRQFGQVALVLSLGSLVSIGTDLGIPLALSKLSCDHHDVDRDAVRGAVLTRVIAGLVAGAVLVALWANTGQAERWWVAGLYAISVIVTPISGSFLALLRGRAIGIVEAGYEVTSKLVLLGVGLATLAAGWKPSGVIAAYVVVDIACALTVPAVSARRLPFSRTADSAQRAELRLRATLPLAAAGILGTAYERIDIWLLAVLKGSASVAIYVAAYKFYDTVLVPAKALASSAVAAAGADVAHNGRMVAKRLAVRAAAVTVPLAVAVGVASPWLLRAAFGNHYGGATSAVALLMIATVPGAALSVITPIALLSRRHLIVRWTMGGLAANIVANLILVPTIGIKGAAAAFLITDAILLVVFYASLPAATSPATPAPAPSPAPAPA